MKNKKRRSSLKYNNKQNDKRDLYIYIYTVSSSKQKKGRNNEIIESFFKLSINSWFTKMKKKK